MANQNKCYDVNRLQLFLNEQLDERDESTVMDHINGCRQCQRSLENIAANRGTWDDLKSHLARHFDVDAGGETISIVERDRDLEMERLQEYLGPTDHPDMLGRLGSYEVCGLVGRGSTGVVVKALEPRLNRFVAIKVLSPTFSSNGPARARFEREARSVAAVSHEHVVPIYAVDEYRGLPFIVMQYIPGGSLLQRIESNGPLDTTEITRIGMQIAKGLAAAHEQGIVHRDVKPANVMLETKVDRAMVSDFGLARVADEAAMTRSGVIAGTPQYMSPEQAKGESVDQRSDLFSLGSVMYHAATGRAPFRAESVFGVIQRVCSNDPRPIREINPTVEPWLASFIEKLHAKDRQDRFDSSSQVADILGKELAHLQGPTISPAPERPWFTKPVESKIKRSQKLAGKSGHLSWWAVLACSLLLAASAGLLWLNPANQNEGSGFLADSQAESLFQSPVIHRNVNGCFECELQRTAIPAKGVNVVRANTHAGSLFVIGSDGDEIILELIRNVRSQDKGMVARVVKSHSVEARREGDVLILSSEMNDKELSRFLKDAELKLYVPRYQKLELENGTGPIIVTDTGGCLDARTRAGMIQLRNVLGESVIKSTKGAISIRGCTNIKASTDTGEIDAIFNCQPRGDSKLITRGGPISIGLSPDIDVDINSFAKIGEIHGVDEFHDEEWQLGKGGPRLQVESGAGNISYYFSLEDEPGQKESYPSVFDLDDVSDITQPEFLDSLEKLIAEGHIRAVIESEEFYRQAKKLNLHELATQVKLGQMEHMKAAIEFARKRWESDNQNCDESRCEESTDAGAGCEESDCEDGECTGSRCEPNCECCCCLNARKKRATVSKRCPKSGQGFPAP